MPKFDREELERFVKANPPAAALALLNRSRPVAPSERSVQARKEAVKVVEEALGKAGVDVQKFRQAFAQSRKQLSEATAASRSRVITREKAVNGGGRFRRLRPLSGLTVPLAPPTLTFLGGAVFFTIDQTDSFLVESALAENETFFRANFIASEPAHFGRYTFCYLWNNESDSPMLAEVSTALDLLGQLLTSAGNGLWNYLGKARTEVNVEGGLTLMVGGDASSTVSVAKGLADVSAETDFFGFWELVQEDASVNESQGMSIDGFIVPGHSTLIIQVWTQFQFFITFGYDDHPGDFGGADFSTGPNRVSCPGVVIIAQPVQTPPGILL
jgi:hypothetical protein